MEKWLDHQTVTKQEEVEILNKRISNLEKKLEEKQKRKKTSKVKK